MVNLTENMS